MGRKIITEEKGRKTVRILIADDEEEMTQALSAILKHEHYSVDTVHDAWRRWITAWRRAVTVLCWIS